MAMPHLTDPNFNRTVVFICEHNEEGAMGLVINRLLPMTLSEVLAGQELDYDSLPDSRVHYGGPVQPEAGFLLYTCEDRPPYVESMQVTDCLCLGTTMNILEDITTGEGPERFIFALGYAGWGEGQLEEELKRNDWLVVPVDERLIFNEPCEKRWEEAIKLLGISPSSLGESFGTA